MTGSTRVTVFLSLAFPLLLVAVSAVAFPVPPVETFDEVVAPQVPSGWFVNYSGNGYPGPGWITVVDGLSAPNAAFADDTSSVTDKRLETVPFHIFAANGRVTFQHKFDLEFNPPTEAYDGVALEIAIGSGPFLDITVAGGSFESGGYNSTTPSGFGNPLAGRSVWSGASPGYQGVVVNLPAAAIDRTIRLRWRMGTDSSGGLTGYWLDNIHVFGATAPTFPPDETFDELATPELPSNWINAVAAGPGPGWLTVLDDDDSPNSAFTDDAATVSDKWLETPPFHVLVNGSVDFRHKLDLEGGASTAFDGVVLEIAYDDGAFVDIVDAGGAFLIGAYDRAVSDCCNNPLAGRAAWGGTSDGYRTVLVTLPQAASGRNARLRWRMGTDFSDGLTGYWVDRIHVNGVTTSAFPPDETFEEVAVPALPPSWINDLAAGPGPGWLTVVGGDTSPTAAFTDDTPTPADKSLMTPTFTVGESEQLSFRHKIDLDASPGAVTYDGVVLEISIAGGPFQDIFAAGGTFASGGYDHVVFASADQPLSGRNAWGGTTSGFQDVVVNLPGASNNVAVRWRMGTDAFAGGTGYWLDDIHLGYPIFDRIFSNDFECSGQACQ